MRRQRASRVAMEWAMILERIANDVIDDVRFDTDDTLGDLRFRAAMSDEERASLPLPIRRRFSKRLAGGKTIVYSRRNPGNDT